MDTNLEEKISIELSKGELLVIFEFLARNMTRGVRPEIGTRIHLC
jgi:hypothetical protein